MPSYMSYKRQMAVLDADDNEIESWITVRGNHIPIKKGQSKEEAVKSFIEKKGGSGEKKESSKYTIPDDYKKSVANYTKEKHEQAANFYGEKMASAQKKANNENDPNVGVHRKHFEEYQTLSHWHAEQAKGEKKTESKKGEKSDHKFTYQMLDRLRTDNEYWLGNGNRADKHLWAGNPKDQIAEMRKLYNSLPADKKPEWLTEKDIDEYEKKMLGEKKSSVKNDLGKFADAYNKLYEDSEAFSYKPSDLSKEYNKAMHNPDFAKWVQEMSKERGDVFMSDREYHALLVVAKEKGLIKEKGKEAPKVTKVDAKKWNSPASDPWKSLYD